MHLQFSPSTIKRHLYRSFHSSTRFGHADQHGIAHKHMQRCAEKKGYEIIPCHLITPYPTQNSDRTHRCTDRSTKCGDRRVSLETHCSLLMYARGRIESRVKNHLHDYNKVTQFRRPSCQTSMHPITHLWRISSRV